MLTEEKWAREQLQKAFEEDHREMTRGLDRVLRAVGEGHLETAARLADDLDRLAGPHIEFEEEVLYPTLVAKLGQPFVDRLYDEHASGKRAIERLTSGTVESEDPSDFRDRVAEDLQEAHQHALSCGTLLSHLETFDETHLREMLTSLERMRAQGKRWTELPDHT